MVVGVVIGARPIADNSFLTHLATGRLLLDQGIPRSDPYSFTAHGLPWVVQSWLASLLYGSIERFIGTGGLVVLHAVQTGVLAAIGWRLTRPATTLISRLLVVIPLIAVGSSLWSPRPLLFGLICLGLVILIAEDERISPWWLLPLGWLWVNMHGSFPFALVYLVARLAGRALDRQPAQRLVRLVLLAAAGLLLGALNPLGARLLTFPAHLLSQREVLSQVIEWMSPDFSKPVNLIFLAQVVLTLVLLTRRGKWEDAVVAGVFAFIGMTALRNTVLASLTLTALLARGAAGVGDIRGERRGAVSSLAFVLVLAVGGGVLWGASSRPAFDLGDYPVAELRWLGREGLLDNRVLTSDIVGNLRTLREGPRARVFIDDRFDMYPSRVSLDYLDLYYGRANAMSILDRYRIDAVVWDQKQALAGALALDERWTIARRSPDWIVAVRRGA